MAPQWITEGTTGLEATGNKLTCTQASSNDICNALWEDAADGVSSGQHYWKLAVLEVGEHTSIFAGVTDKDKFKPGWALKALLFGGNLSSGSALLVEQFGPELKAGDVLGIFVKLDESNFKVYLDVNGSSLGLAFDLPKNIFKGLFPVVHFNGAATVQIDKVDGAPGSLTRPAPAHVGIEGDWELAKNEFKVGGVVQELASPVTLSLKKSGGEKYSGHLKIVNSIGFGLEKQGSDWKATPGMSTRMMGSPEAMKLEGQMTELTANPTKVEVEGSNLVWSSDSKSMESKWQRFEVEKSPVTRNPF